MTVEEILNWMNQNDENRTNLLTTLTKDGTLFTSEQVSAANKDLEANKNLILQEKRETKAKLDDALKKLVEYEKGDASDVTAARIKAMEAELAKAAEERDRLTNEINDGFMTQHVKNKLTEMNVSRQSMDILTTYFKGQAALKEVETPAGQKERYVMFGDKMSDTFFAEWGKSAEAKAFIGAPVNAGGGASGGKEGTKNSGAEPLFTSDMFK